MTLSEIWNSYKTPIVLVLVILAIVSVGLGVSAFLKETTAGQQISQQITEQGSQIAYNVSKQTAPIQNFVPKNPIDTCLISNTNSCFPVLGVQKNLDGNYQLIFQPNTTNSVDTATQNSALLGQLYFGIGAQESEVFGPARAVIDSCLVPAGNQTGINPVIVGLIYKQLWQLQVPLDKGELKGSLPSSYHYYDPVAFCKALTADLERMNLLFFAGDITSSPIYSQLSDKQKALATALNSQSLSTAQKNLALFYGGYFNQSYYDQIVGIIKGSVPAIQNFSVRKASTSTDVRPDPTSPNQDAYLFCLPNENQGVLCQNLGVKNEYTCWFSGKSDPCAWGGSYTPQNIKALNLPTR